jgi:hypothetical protein
MTQSPPVTLTGNVALDWIIIIVSVLGYLYWLKAIRLARESVRPALVLFLVGFCLGLFYYSRYGAIRGDKPWADCIVIGLLTTLLLRRKRSRHIPAAVRKAVIARDLKGKKYDSRKHHIDHKWAFARGGSHTRDNLRVIGKKENLRKGSRKPGLWEMFFR